MVSLNYPVVTCGAECWLGTLSAVLRMPLLQLRTSVSGGVLLITSEVMAEFSA